MRILNICVFTQQFGFAESGIGTIAGTLVHELAAHGHRVTVVCPDTNKKETSDALVVIPFVDRHIVRSHARWLSYAWKFKTIFYKQLAGTVFDLLLFTEARESFFFPSLSAAPIIGMQNDYYFSLRFAERLRYLKIYKDWPLRFLYATAMFYLDKHALKKIDTILPLSRAIKDQITTAYHLNKLKTAVVYSTISISGHHAPVGHALNNRSRFTIVFIGGNFQRKGLLVLLRAAVALRVPIPNLHIVVVGRDKSRPVIEREARRIGVHNIVEFTGYLDNRNVLDILKNTDIMVLPSYMEGLGLSLLEAMACGVPVIGSNTGGIPEIITDRYNGLLVEPGNHESLADAISLVYTNRELRETMIQNGYKTIGRFSVDAMMQGMLRVIDEVMQSNRVKS